jgi:hypothetical protein
MDVGDRVETEVRGSCIGSRGQRHGLWYKRGMGCREHR